MTTTPKIPFVTAILLIGLFSAVPAEAFRCGSRLVIDGMHEQQVVAICGEPATRRHLGYAVRPYDLQRRRELGAGFSRGYWRGSIGLSEEVVITEYVYNFGPRRLMRGLIFEGGILVEIEPIGYGY